ncbi:hypothetical protein [Streptomyces sp. NPDC052107]|uniref:MmyB family transcriptional regulator n=1 Tax=Streptomyces sp. NPDC052107 TaxID=3155632 RepID=UPI0034126709
MCRASAVAVTVPRSRRVRRICSFRMSHSAMRARYRPLSGATGPPCSSPPCRAPRRRPYGNGEEVAAATVAHLRAAAGRRPDAPDVTGVVGELRVRSEEFAALWQSYEVRSRTNGRKHFTHPPPAPRP